MKLKKFSSKRNSEETFHFKKKAGIETKVNLIESVREPLHRITFMKHFIESLHQSLYRITSSRTSLSNIS